MRSVPVAVVPLLLLAVALHAENQSETYPDGSRQLSVALDRQGSRSGALTAWWPGGKILKEKSQWKAGRLNGERMLYDEKGRLATEETWLDGRLIYPRTQAQTAETMARIEAETTRWIGTWKRPANPAVASTADLAKALVRLRQYRFLCGLSWDVVLDERYSDEAQFGAKILADLGRLDHHPTRPAGWSDADYAKASDACGHGNLAMGPGDLAHAVDLWMDDSDASNIGVLGHRRWLLNPPMLACGFGIAGKYSVIWAHDQARTDPAPQRWQAFPPPGFMPAEMFSERHAWHISLNPSDYDVDAKGERFTIYPLDRQLQRSGAAYSLEHDGSDATGYGCYGNARIVRPDAKTVPRGQPAYGIAKGRSYEAVVGGLKPKGDAPAEIDWVVTFY